MPKSLTKLVSLKLDFSYNWLKEFPFKNIANKANLKTLELNASTNFIDEIPQNFKFDDFNQLENLSFSIG